MTRSLIAVAALLLATNVAPGQLPGAAAKAAAQKAAGAANAHVEAEQNTDQQPQKKAEPKTQRAPAKTPAQTKAAPPQTKAPAQKKGAGASKTGAKAPAAPTAPAADTSGPPPTIYREAFAYTPNGRRDPFNSLLLTNELRPTLSDLKITGILFDPSGRRSQATLRDIGTNKQYSNVTIGTTLGRMRVAAIRPHVIVFTIDEFGTTRQDSLVLGDTTKARVK